jgi:hypothetical protein
MAAHQLIPLVDPNREPAWWAEVVAGDDSDLARGR